MKEERYPPKWIYKLLERFCDPYLWEGISGDLFEVYRENVESKGVLKANWMYTLQSIGFLRKKFKKNEKRTSSMKSIWSNYLLTSFRSLKKQKTLFAINLVGLIMAISCSLFALIYINDELQFDKQHGDGDQIYRLYKRYINVTENVDHLTYETSGMMGPAMKEEFPEIEEYVRVLPWWHTIILTYKEKNIVTESMYFADSTFFDFFDFKVLAGNPSTLLTAPSSIVLSESVAKSIFGEENPIGKEVIGLNYLTYTVTGIFEDTPRQSSMQFDAVVSWSTTVPGVGPWGMNWMNNWLSQGIYTFVRIPKGTNPQIVVEKFPDMMNRHFEERADQYFLKLLPLAKMHLHGEDIKGSERMKSGSITFVYMLGFSAFLIFLIASVNYINIALSRATQRRTEVGVRKVLGSTRKQLMARFITETFFSTFIASILSVFIILWFLPMANSISGKELPISALFQPITIFAILGFIFITCVIVGLYPALVLSSPPISAILKSSSGAIGSTGWFRRALLTLQYSISIFLIICTIAVIRQANYLENKPLGLDKEQVLVVDIGNEVSDKFDILETRLLSHPNIISVSTSRSTFGDGSYTTTVVPEGFSGELNTRIFGVDQEFFETFGIKTLAGRTFLKGSIADTGSLIVNKALVDFMKWKDPIGKHIRFSPESTPLPIIGMVNDFHIHSLATDVVEPMILYLDVDNRWFTAIRIGNGDIKQTVDFLQKTWDELAGRTPLSFFFVDQWFNEQYKNERQLLKISSMYSIISILLCALGLYGLTALLLQQRTKEISIRKVLGAPVASIISMMNKQFLIIILISFLFSAPLSYYLVLDWLDQFAYKISINPTSFILSGGLTLLISILIVSVLAMKSANENPSKNLNSE